MVYSVSDYKRFPAIPEPMARQETIAWIRGEFERTRSVQEVEVIKNRLSSIRRDLKKLLPSIGLSSGKL